MIRETVDGLLVEYECFNGYYVSAIPDEVGEFYVEEEMWYWCARTKGPDCQFLADGHTRSLSAAKASACAAVRDGKPQGMTDNQYAALFFAFMVAMTVTFGLGYWLG